MLTFLKRRALLVVIGLVLIALFILIAGPYVAFAGYQPLQSLTARVALIVLVVLVWETVYLLKAARSNRASDKLMAAVVEQKEPAAGAATDALRRTFEDAIVELKQQRRRGHSLYDLPWYVIIGPPGSGKSTALENSGLRFPVRQRSGRADLSGVGGTRNCKWWFTDQAVLLDTAGRYTTQDSDAESDSREWNEFVTLLRRYRKRRPVNGVILTISAQDLLTQWQKVRDDHVAAVRRRLEELNHELRIQLPIYVMVTKCDLVAGFTEYFDDLSKESRAQVWGVTFPYNRTVDGGAVQMFPSEFDALISRLNERVYSRLEEVRDVRRSATVFGFPQQLAVLRESLVDFVTEVFSSTRFDRRVLLRGVYFTSGTQEGNPIDRLMSAAVRHLNVAPEAVTISTGPGKAYFIERLLKDVLIAESGLAGLNRRFELQKAAAQLGSYAAMAALAVLGVAVLSWSYNRNRTYIGEVAARIDHLQQVSGPSASRALDTLVPRLDALRDVVDTAGRYEARVPIGMRWGLYQGRSLSKTAQDAYERELYNSLLPRVVSQFEQRIVDYGTQPEKLYEYLKAYLMLEQPSHLDPAHVSAMADLEWGAQYAAQPDIAAALSKHLQHLVAKRQFLQPSATNPELVQRARSTIRQASVPHLIYSRLKLNHSDDRRVVQLDVAAGVGADVFRRKSGTPLSTPVLAIYTAPVFQEIVTSGFARVTKQFADEQWIWGEGGQPPTPSGTLSRDVMAIYEDDYIATWDRILNDVELVPAVSSASVADLLGRLGGRTSPLRGLLQTVDGNTYLIKPPEPAKPAGAPTAADKATDAVKKLFGGGQVASTASVPYGARITMHFDQIHQLVTGPAGSAPIDRVIDMMGRLAQQLAVVDPNVIGGAPNPAGANDVLRQMQTESGALPPVVKTLVLQAFDRSTGTVRAGIQADLNNRYQQQVASACRQVVNGNYPFVASSAMDAPVGDVARLFASQGVFDAFFKSNLDALVDSSRTPWRWKTDVAGAPVVGSTAMLRQFETARRIGEMYFPSGLQGSVVQFTVTPTYLDEKALGFVLDIDGQSFENRHTPSVARRATWPGPIPGVAAIRFQDGSSAQPNRQFTGQWSLFRLLGSAQIQSLSATRYELTFQVGGHEAKVLFEAQSVRNPFVTRDLEQFRCELL